MNGEKQDRTGQDRTGQDTRQGQAEALTNVTRKLAEAEGFFLFLSFLFLFSKCNLVRGASESGNGTIPFMDVSGGCGQDRGTADVFVYLGTVDWLRAFLVVCFVGVPVGVSASRVSCLASRCTCQNVRSRSCQAKHGSTGSDARCQMSDVRTLCVSKIGER